MPAVITGIDENSPLRGKAEAGETLAAINGCVVNDVFDYLYQCTGKELSVTIAAADGRSREIAVSKEEYEDLGLSFSSYLMDDKRRCANGCIFCFIDQLPPGLRESLYFKDDDARMSLLSGNYITLTNLSDEEIERIIRLKISPVNVSVHATDPELRSFMMRNRKAAQGIEIMKRLAAAGIDMNCQVVLCKGINDGAQLDNTIEVLSQMYPSVNSLSVVPVGITKFREGLFPLEPFETADAQEVISRIERKAAKIREQQGVSFVYAADEFYLLAGREIPDAAHYDDFPQLENGVGMMALMRDEFGAAYKELKCSRRKINCSIATGKAAATYIEGLLWSLKQKYVNLEYRVHAIENNFFGEHITVSGLVTGTDLARQLKGQGIKHLLIPDNMLRYDKEMFLDDMTPKQLEELLDAKVTAVPSDGACFIQAVINA